MRWVPILLAGLLAGCATTKTPTATNLADSSPLTVSVKRARGFPSRDAELTVFDPKTGETFTGRIPGTKPELLAPGYSWIALPLPEESVGMLKGDKGGTLVCRFRPRTGTGTCVTPLNGMVYVDF